MYANIVVLCCCSAIAAGSLNLNHHNNVIINVNDEDDNPEHHHQGDAAMLATTPAGQNVSSKSCVEFNERCSASGAPCCAVGTVWQPLCDTHPNRSPSRCFCFHANTTCAIDSDCCTNQCNKFTKTCACGTRGAICFIKNPVTCCSGFTCTAQDNPIPVGNGLCEDAPAPG